MQKLTIIGGFILILGVIVFAVALSFKGWDISKISTRPAYDEKSYTAENTNQDITIKDYNMPVTVGLSKDDRIHLTYFENEKEYYEIADGAELSFKKVSDYKWYDYVFNINYQSPSVNILLPEAFSGKLDIKTSNGKITVDNVSAELLTIISSNGSVSISSVNDVGNITVCTSNASIKASEINLKADLICTTNNGSIQLDNISAQYIKASTSNNKIIARDTKAIDSTELETSNGYIELKNLSSGNSIDLNASNGSIKGSIVGKAGDFTIKSRTSNAKNNLPENMKGGSKMFSAVTSNGAISIEFTD